MWLVIVPVLSSSLQYLQPILLQNVNPLSLGRVPRYVDLGVCVVGLVLGVTVFVAVLRNLSKVVCIVVLEVEVGVCTSFLSGAGTCCGFDFSSPSM